MSDLFHFFQQFHQYYNLLIPQIIKTRFVILLKFTL